MPIALQGNRHAIAATAESAAGAKRVTTLIGVRPNHQMTVDEALELAAWLVAVADEPDHKRFDEILEAVWNT